MTLNWFVLNRKNLPFSLNHLYRVTGLTKQAMHQWKARQDNKNEEWNQILPLIYNIRTEHPGMSARVMYHLIQPQTLGRDQFIEHCMATGFKLEVKRNPTKTTDSTGVKRFPNLIKGRKTNRINQVWVSDITFYQIQDRFYYLTFIMDIKSRFIVGHQVSKSLRTEDTTLPSLSKALKNHFFSGKGLTFHSDGGGQYYCKKFLELTKVHKIKNSMTQDLGENNHAERINGTIKNQYLKYYMPTSFDELKTQVDRAVKNYNYSKPHENLQKATPSMIYGVWSDSALSYQYKMYNKLGKTH